MKGRSFRACVGDNFDEEANEDDDEARAAFLILILALSSDLSSAATNLLRKGLIVSGTRGLEANWGPLRFALLGGTVLAALPACLSASISGIFTLLLEV